MRGRIRTIKFQMLLVACIFGILLQSGPITAAESLRERISINTDWRFTRNDPVAGAMDSTADRLTDKLNYPLNPGRGGSRDRGSTAMPTVDPTSGIAAYILPTGNDFIDDPAKRYVRPVGNFGEEVPYVNPTFNDSDWRKVDLPHDFAVEGPFNRSAGVAWYRKHLTIPATDNGDPTDFKIFSSHDRKAFNGLAMVIIRGKPEQTGTVKLKAESDSLQSATVTLQSIAESPNTSAAKHVDGKEEPKAQPARNPIIWADVPDVAVIRVGDTYYMSSTTMHMSPGLPIMKSGDLVNWELIGYAYDRLVENDAMNLENGRSCYGRGSWASSFRYHNGTYYVSTFSSTSRRTHIYTTRDIEKGDWKATSFAPSLHDHSLFFDDDGRVYMLYGVGDLRLVELEPDLSGIKEDGFNEVVIRNVIGLSGRNAGLRGEGSQLCKINGKYYVMNIIWPRGDMRTQTIHRADRITGPYEGRVILHDRGVAQGCLIDTPDGKWYAVLFQDNGSVGRSPWLVPVRWEDGWPVLGVGGKAPLTLDIDDKKEGLANIVASDEFNRKPGEPLPLAWQWNHNPDNRYWSVGERSGCLRLTTGRVDKDVLGARNVLTQRTFGPVSAAITKIDVTRMKNGDCAGLIALQKKYGFVGVRMEGNSKSIVMVSAQSNQPEEIESIPLAQPIVYLKIDCDFRNRTDKACFYYSLDGGMWTKIGSVLQMAYTLPHFMGYRFGLFNFATKTAGGFVDFDFFRIDNTLTGPDSADVAGIISNQDGRVTPSSVDSPG